MFQNCDIGAKQVLLYKKQKLTVGRLKQIIEHSLVENDAENSEESIVAGGIKGADFHYLGLRNDTLYANEPIIVDIFPRRIEVKNGIMQISLAPLFEERFRKKSRNYSNQLKRFSMTSLISYRLEETQKTW